MKKIILLGILVLFSPFTVAENSISRSKDTEAIFLMNGTCTEALINSKEENSCKGILSHSVFKSGTLLFMYVFSKSETDFFALKFFGDSEINRGDDEKVMPVSYIEINSPNTKKSYKAVGKCIFQNPYNGMLAKIECEADTENGVMKAKFLTDGNEPKNF
ncbi:hypothetical protein OHW31_19300 [Acinetobacter baumannii]|nr:hypothetical protein [Acinetobacter baumannii]